MTAVADGGSLCQRCGLCCDGTLHAAVHLKPVDVPAARAAGLIVVSSGDDHRFALPCPMHRDLTCTVYESRPGTCRTYRCEVLKACENGTLSFDEGLRRVERAKELQRAVVSLLPANVSMTDARRALDAAWDPDAHRFASASLHPSDGPYVLALFALGRYLSKHFRNPS